MKKVSLLFLTFLTLVCVNVKAQDLAQLVSDFKSSTRLNNIKQMETAKKSAQDCGIKSLDQLASSSTNILESLFAVSDTIPSVYTRVLGETMDGLANDDVQKPSVDELESLSNQIAANSQVIADASKNLDSATEDVSKIRNPLQVKKATESLNYSKNTLKYAKDEIALQTKMVAALSKQLKSDVGL